MEADANKSLGVSAALAEYAGRFSNIEALQATSSVLAYSSEFILANGQRRHVGGYADRLKGVLSTALLAMLSERRFVAEWETPHPIRHVLAVNALDWEMKPERHAAARAQRTIVDAIDDAAHTRFRTQLLQRPDVFDRLNGHAHLIQVHSNINYIVDLLANPSLLGRTRLGRLLASAVTATGVDAVAAWLPGTLFRFLFRYVPRGVMLDAWLRFLEVRQSRSMVGVQFRTGGGGQWIDPTLDSLANVNRIAASATTVAQARGLADPVFFVSSDYATASEALADALQPHGEVLRFDFPAVHFERSTNVDFVVQTDAPVLEHMCLAHCDVVVHGRGGFGATAAAIGGIPAVVYDQS